MNSDHTRYKYVFLKLNVHSHQSVYSHPTNWSVYVDAPELLELNPLIVSPVLLINKEG